MVGQDARQEVGDAICHSLHMGVFSILMRYAHLRRYAHPIGYVHWCGINIDKVCTSDMVSTQMRCARLVWYAHCSGMHTEIVRILMQLFTSCISDYEQPVYLHDCQPPSVCHVTDYMVGV